MEEKKISVPFSLICQHLLTSRFSPIFFSACVWVRIAFSLFFCARARSCEQNVSFGAYENEEEAARQYDRALIIQRGKSAKTNFNVFLYQTEIMEYEKFVSELPPAKQAEARRTTTLPFGRKPQQTGKRGTSAALIFAEEVKKALHFGE